MLAIDKGWWGGWGGPFYKTFSKAVPFRTFCVICTSGIIGDLKWKVRMDLIGSHFKTANSHSGGLFECTER